jgi:hypothetical protein
MGAASGFDAAADRKSVEGRIAKDLAFANRHGGKGDLYLVAAILLGSVGLSVVTGDLVSVALIGVVPVAGLVGWAWYKRGWRAVKARRSVVAEWMKHFDTFCPHAISGEKIDVISTDLSGKYVDVQFADGCKLSIDCMLLQDDGGKPYPFNHDTNWPIEIAATRRLSKASWKTDGGQVGYVRAFKTGCASEYGPADPDRLLLRLKDGHAWVPVRELTPVGGVLAESSDRMEKDDPPAALRGVV